MKITIESYKLKSHCDSTSENNWLCKHYWFQNRFLWFHSRVYEISASVGPLGLNHVPEGKIKLLGWCPQHHSVLNQVISVPEREAKRMRQPWIMMQVLLEAAQGVEKDEMSTNDGNKVSRKLLRKDQRATIIDSIKTMSLNTIAHEVKLRLHEQLQSSEQILKVNTWVWWIMKNYCYLWSNTITIYL